MTASTGSFPGSTVSFTTAVDGSSDFGNDTGGHTTSTKVCEVCHSKTNYHRYDTTGQTDGLDHYNQADCTKCHEHKQRLPRLLQRLPRQPAAVDGPS